MYGSTKIIAFAAVVALVGCTPEIRNHKINVRGKLYDMRETYQPSSMGGGTSGFVLFADGISFSCSLSEFGCVKQLEEYLDEQKTLGKTKAPQPTSKSTGVSQPGPNLDREVGGGD